MSWNIGKSNQQYYAESFINTVHEPLIALDQDLRVVSANRAFYEIFKVRPENTVGQLIYDLGNKQWDIPKLRELLETILPEKTTLENYEVEHEFADIGKRTMLWNVRQIKRGAGKKYLILLAIEDITERKRLEKELLMVEEAAFKTLLDNSAEGILLLGLESKKFYMANPAICRMLGYTLEEMTDCGVADLHTEGDLPRVVEQLEKQTSKEILLTQDLPIKTKAGMIIYADVHSTRITMAGKEYLMKFLHDNTARKKAELELEKAKLRLELATEAGRIGIWEIDLIHHTSVRNSIHDQIFGYKENLENWELKTFFDHILAEDRPMVKAAFDQTLKNNRSHLECRIVWPDQTIHWITTRARVILDNAGKPEKILGIVMDITRAKESEEALQRSNAVLRAQSEAAIDGILVVDENGKILSFNRNFIDMWGVPEEAMASKSDGQALLSVMNKLPDPHEFVAKVRYLYANREETSRDELILKDGRIFDRYSAPLFSAEKIYYGRMWTFRDITELKQLDRIKSARDIAEANTRAKSVFLANMSHELRTPLNSINGFSEVLSDRTFGPLNEKQQRYVSNILTSGRHLLLLINQTLDLAKIEAGKMSLTVSKVRTKSLLENIALMVADLAAKKQLHAELEIAEDLPDIEADELKVKEIVFNLLSNAIKFTPEGGKYGVRAKKADGGLEIEIWDNGIGIEPEYLEKIFEGFFRVDAPYSHKTEGTGLGLPLSRKLVELHGGKLLVESAGFNKGFLARVTLPIIAKVS